jgi:hypothetical protein
MRRFLQQIGPLALVTTILFVEPSMAEIVTPSGQSDALAHRYWYSGYNGYWVDNETSTSLAAYRDTSGEFTSDRWWDIPVLEFPLAGVSANLATLNFYVSAAGAGSMWVRYVGGDDDGVIAATDWLNAGSEVGTFDGGVTGWQSFDVTSQFQEGITSGYNWIVFTVGSAEQRASATVSASESGSSSPFLDVVPEPSIFALLGAGAICLLAFTWRQLPSRNRQS